MSINLAAMPGLWTVLLVVFVVVPAVRWSLEGSRRGRRRGRMLGGAWLEDAERAGHPLRQRDIDALRSELAERLGEIDLLNSRVAELENRLDFTERLLARQPASIEIPPASAGSPGPASPLVVPATRG
jgi:hypothetical protein